MLDLSILAQDDTAVSRTRLILPTRVRYLQSHKSVKQGRYAQCLSGVLSYRLNGMVRPFMVDNFRYLSITGWWERIGGAGFVLPAGLWLLNVRRPAGLALQLATGAPDRTCLSLWCMNFHWCVGRAGLP